MSLKHVLLQREIMTDEYTLGRMYVDGLPFGATCEDTDRELELYPEAKVKGKTAIPRGLYHLTVTFSNRFQRQMLLILAVPGFEDVRIHGGNTAADTEGCPLYGRVRTETGVAQCKEICNALCEMVEEAEALGGVVWIEIK